jgi:hypothetical protein
LLFADGFDIGQQIGAWGGSFAFHLEADSVAVGFADILVGNSRRYASTFEHRRIGKMFGLRCCPFCCSQIPLHTNS